MMKTVLSALALVGAVGAADAAPMAKYSAMPESEIKALFVDHIVQHNKVYSSVDEFRVRLENFKANLAIADEHNAKNPSARFGPTKFSDLSAAEFKARYLNPNARPKNLDGPFANVTALAQAKRRVDASDGAGGIDWRPKAGTYINHVQNQEQCGSCWAFSTTENVASTNAIAGNGLYVLSVQQVVDCDGTSYGCNGGEPDSAYNYIQNAGGLETAAEYPYTAENGQCQFDKSKVKVSIDGFNWIAQNEGSSSDQAIQAMKTAVATQPLSICAAASTWQNYQGGILTNCDNQVDHCIELDGYSPGDGQPYWIVRNSWATDWGIDGYIYVAIGQNLCEIQSTVSTSYVN